MSSVFMYANHLAGYSAIVFILSLGLWIESFQNSPKQNGREDRTIQNLKLTSERFVVLENNAGAGKWGCSFASPHISQDGAATPHFFRSLKGKLCQGFKIQNPLATRLFLTVAVLGNLVALILTNSRNAWAIAAIAAIAFAVYLRWYWLVALVLAFSLSVILAAFAPAPIGLSLRQIVPDYFWQRLTDQLYPNRPVVSLRSTQWQFAWELTRQRPLTGWGLRNFQPLYQLQMHAWFGHPHNLFLMLSAETGIPATLIFCGWVIWIFWQGIKFLLPWSQTTKNHHPMLNREKLIFFSYQVALVACIIFNTVDVTIFDLRLNTLVWVVLSAVAGVVYHQHDAASNQRQNS